MKKNIHPQYNTNCKVSCSCGNTYAVGSTIDEIVTELCSKCHPFYTGEQKIVDTENLVAKFKERKSKAKESFKSKKKRMAEKNKKVSAIKAKSTPASELTLKDMLASLEA